jgi:hypothetical protein
LTVSTRDFSIFTGVTRPLTLTERPNFPP